MKIGISLSSGVGEFGGSKWDGIGQLADKLRAFPHVTTFVNRIPRDRGRMGAKVREMASALTHEHDFDAVYLVGHSRGVEFILDVAREMDAPVDCVFSADGWNREGELVVPANVCYGESWTQDRFRPRGVPIRCERAATEWVRHPPLTDVPHRKMSQLPEFHNAVLSLAKGETP